LYVARITEHNASLPIIKISEQDRAQFTHKWKAAEFDNSAVVSHGILQTGMRNLAKFPAENCGPY